MTTMKNDLNSKSFELQIAKEKESLIDQLTDSMSDWFSPILVKETRQALKSRQFFWTFFLLLVAIAIWTMIGLTINGPNSQIASAGPALLTGYWTILGFPLAIVIPFGAYRSLAREFEDGTIQLVSVTTMKSWQIVAGKLGSSLLQMMVYVSVLAPCIAFTYLLRGISLPQITVGMTICICGSFTLCCIALFMASATKSKVFGVAISIVLIVIQFGIYFMWIAFASGLSFSELAFLTGGGGMFLTAGIVAALLSTGLLMFAAATSLISFDADNRSTIVRLMMLVQQTLFIAWAISMMCFVMFPEQSMVLTFVTAHYWMIVGFVLVGESRNLSSRVKRSIPNSMLAKTYISFLLPGPGRGLIFAISNIWFCAGCFFCLYYFGFEWLPETTVEAVGMGSPSRRFFGPGDLERNVAGIFSVCTYASFFVSLVYFMSQMMAARSKINGAVSFALGLVLVSGITGGSLLFHFNFIEPSEVRYYSLDQLFNWYWTSIEVVENGFTNLSPVVAAAAAVVMTGFNLLAIFLASAELRTERTDTPDRVQWDRKEERQFEKPPKGETIDDIFGELEKNSERTDDTT